MKFKEKILKNELYKNIFTIMAGTSVSQLIPILIGPFLTRIYSPENFGTYTLFISILSLFAVISNGRYEFALLLPENENDSLNILILGYIINFSLSLFVFLFVLFFSNHIVLLLKNKDIKIWLFFLPITLFMYGSFNALNSFNNKIKKYKDIASSTIIKSITLAVIQISIGFFTSISGGLIIGQIASQFTANIKLIKNIISHHNIKKVVSKQKIILLAKKYKDFPKYQTPHALFNTFSSNIPVYFFSVFFSSTVVGIYGLSTRIVLMPLMILASSTAKVYSQKISQIFNEKGNCYQFTIKLIKSLFAKIIIPFLLIVIFAPYIFSVLFGPEWKLAGIYTQILSPWLLMVFLVGTISFIPSLLNLQKKALILEIIYTILRIISISIGIYFKNIYISLACFSAVGFFMLNYTFFWMLKSLKEYEKWQESTEFIQNKV